MFCRNCGAQISGPARFCPQCGAKLATEDLQTFGAATTDDSFKPTEPAERTRQIEPMEQPEPIEEETAERTRQIEPMEQPEPIEEETAELSGSFDGSVPVEPAEQPTAAEQTEPVGRAKKGSKYRDLVPTVRTMLILRCVVAAICLLTVVAVLFVPIFKFQPDDESIFLLSEKQQEEVFEKYVETGKIPELTYSAFDELHQFRKFVEAVKDGNVEDGYVILIVFIFVVGLWIEAIFLIASYAKSLITYAVQLADLDNTAFLHYEMIRRAGDKPSKFSFIRKNAIISLFIFAVFNIVYGKLYGTLAPLNKMKNSVIFYNAQFCNVSFAIAVPIVLLVGYLIVNSRAEDKEQDIRLTITRGEN